MDTGLGCHYYDKTGYRLFHKHISFCLSHVRFFSLLFFLFHVLLALFAPCCPQYNSFNFIPLFLQSLSPTLKKTPFHLDSLGYGNSTFSLTSYALWRSFFFLFLKKPKGSRVSRGGRVDLYSLCSLSPFFPSLPITC